MAAKNNTNRTTAEEVLRRYNEEQLPDFCEPLTDVNQVALSATDQSTSQVIGEIWLTFKH